MKKYQLPKEFKGTQGEWILNTVKTDGEVSEIYITQESGGCILCVNDGDDNYNIEQDLANAKLICAAPELLDALCDLMSHYDKHGQLLTWNVDIARQAINKALL